MQGEYYLSALRDGCLASVDRAIDAYLGRQSALEPVRRGFLDRLGGLQGRLRGAAAVPVTQGHLETVAPLLDAYAEHLGGLIEQGGQLDAPYDSGERPVWDAGRRELRYRGIVVGQYRRYGDDAIGVVLAVFNEEHWATRIDDPVAWPPDADEADGRRYLVRSLNKRLTGIRFQVAGDGFRWDPISS